MVRAYLVWSTLVSFLLLACGPVEESRTEIDLFEPREYGSYDYRPSGIHPADRYPWVSDVENVHFHTLEDSEETRLQWEPIYEKWKDEPLRPENSPILPPFDLEIEFRTLLRSDTQTEALNYPMLENRGVYYGLKLPGSNDTVHMFECTYEAQEAIYRVDEILIECAGKRGMNLHVETQEDTRFARLEHAPKIGQPYYDWWLETYQAAEEAWDTGNSNEYRRTHIYIHMTDVNIGVRAERMLTIQRLRGACIDCGPRGPSDYSYIGPFTAIPEEMCTDFAVSRNNCSRHGQRDF